MEEIFIPATGMAMGEAELQTWLKRPGDPVVAGDPVATIETDKVTVDLIAETDGVLGPHLAHEGEVVSTGTVVTTVVKAAGEPSTPGAPAAVSETESAISELTASSVPTSTPVPDPAPDPDMGSDSGAEGRRPHTLSPRQRRLQREAAEASAQSQPWVASPSAQSPPPGSPDVQIRDAAAQRAVPDGAVVRAVTESWRTIPHFATSREIDVGGLIEYRRQSARLGTELGITDLLLVACGRAWAAVRGDGVDSVGLSVETPRRVVNVAIADVASGGISQTAARRRDAVQRARLGRLKPSDLASCDLTLSNLGPQGVDWFTGIVPNGQLCLVTVGRIREVPALERGRVVSSHKMWATANLDHRFLDGVDGARFLEAFERGCSIDLVNPTVHAGTRVGT